MAALAVAQVAGLVLRRTATHEGRREGGDSRQEPNLASLAPSAPPSHPTTSRPPYPPNTHTSAAAGPARPAGRTLGPVQADARRARADTSWRAGWRRLWPGWRPGMLRDCGRGEEAAGSSGYKPAAPRLAPRDPTPEDRTLVSCSASAGGPSGPVGCRGGGGWGSGGAWCRTRDTRRLKAAKEIWSGPSPVRPPSSSSACPHPPAPRRHRLRRRVASPGSRAAPCVPAGASRPGPAGRGRPGPACGHPAKEPAPPAIAEPVTA